MNKVIHSKPKEHGQSLVELALTITILMVLLAGTIDLGRAFFTWLAMRDAAQEGASFGSINPPSSDLTCDETTTDPGPEICERIWDNLLLTVNKDRAEIGQFITINIDIVNTPCLGNTIESRVNYRRISPSHAILRHSSGWSNYSYPRHNKRYNLDPTM